MSEPLERLLSPLEVAERCGLSRLAIYRAIERGELEASKLCGKWRIRPSDLDAWIDANRSAPQSPSTASAPRRQSGRRGRLGEILGA